MEPFPIQVQPPNIQQSDNRQHHVHWQWHCPRTCPGPSPQTPATDPVQHFAVGGQLVIPTGLYSDRSIFRQVYIPTGRYSDRSLFRQVYIPTGYSDRSIFRQVVIPTGLYSDRSIFRQVSIPTSRYSDRSLFRKFLDVNCNGN